MKKCNRCELVKELTEFTINRSRKDGLNGTCRTCQRGYNKSHYERNKSYYVAKAERSGAKYAEEFATLVRKLKEVPCKDCGNSYPYYVMDFDHVRGEKIACISTMVGRQNDKERVLAELEKCEVVCSNCHRERTYRRALAVESYQTC